MKNILLIVLLAVSSASFSQSIWSEPGALKANNIILAVHCDATGNAYAGGKFKNSNGDFIVVKWNGTVWGEMGGGVTSLYANNYIQTICSDATGNIYAAGKFRNSQSKNYVAKWTGAKWSEVGSLNVQADINSICADTKGNIYAAGAFKNTNGKYYVSKWDGTKWAELGAGGNALSSDSLIYTIAVDTAGNVYAAGRITNSSGMKYVAKWDGTTWTELGGTSATPLNANDYINSICTDIAGNVYAGGGFTNTNGDYSLAMYNGTDWNEVGGGSSSIAANDDINSICIGTGGSIYAAGKFTNAAGKQYVAKWNGAKWSELGAGAKALNAGDVINAISVDKNSSVYAGGYFKNAAGSNYVAKYTFINGISDISTSNEVQIYPNPANNYITISTSNKTQFKTEVYTIDGKLLKYTNHNSIVNNILDISDLSHGVYMLKVIDNTGVSTSRIVVER